MSATSKPAASSPPAPAQPRRERDTDASSCARKHLRFGWWSLLFFLSLGIALEVLHGFKVDAYLAVSSETRRLMWTLAHAHGTLLALVNVAFAVTVPMAPAWDVRSRGLASACLLGASVLLPAGFFLGGVVTYAGDPGLGIFLVPPGALLLFAAVFETARELRKLPRSAEPSSGGGKRR
jgi:hypothetical protein